MWAQHPGGKRGCHQDGRAERDREALQPERLQGDRCGVQRSASSTRQVWPWQRKISLYGRSLQAICQERLSSVTKAHTRRIIANADNIKVHRFPFGMKIKSSHTISVHLRNIFWNVFFETKKRGVSLDRHFPWLENHSNEVIICEAIISSVTVGGLVIRLKKYIIEEKEIKVGMIGLVCVKTEHRGQGIAKELLIEAIQYAKSENFDYLTLWTSQHHIYARHQFQLLDTWLYGGGGFDSTCEKIVTHKLDLLAHWTENMILPLPPYARKIYEYKSDQCQIVLVEDILGYIVASYQGDVVNVASVIVTSLPTQWRLNVVQDDPLISVLNDCGVTLNLLPVNLQMWLDLKGTDPQYIIVNKIVVPVLERI